MNSPPTLIAKLAKAAPFLIAIKEEESFAKAATRLALDQSAISHRIRALEQDLGFALFERTTRKLRLTQAGKVLCSAAADTTALWKAALLQIQSSQASQQIRLSLPSSLAMKWLLPALSSAKDAGLNLSLEVSDAFVDLHGAEADAAIRFGSGPYPGLHVDHLAHCELTPVVSSSLPDLPEDVFSQSNFGNVPLLADRRGAQDSTGYSWPEYFQDRSLPNIDVPSHLSFDRADLMLQAAVNGMGIALGRTLLIEQDLGAGFLKRAAPSVPSNSKYWLVAAAEFAGTANYRLLLDWLKKEVATTQNSLR